MDVTNHPPLLLPYIKNLRWEKDLQDSVATKSSSAANLSILKVQNALLDLSAGLSVLYQCFPVATVSKIARTEIQNMEDEFYHLTVKGIDLMTYVRRFQELAALCPTIMSDSEKIIKLLSGDYLEVLMGMLSPLKLKL
nr:reverse transcriptase domain-containing protein [Tanacetum cinerariifolium]